MKTYLLKIKQYDILINDYKLKVYKVTTDNIYRIIGKIYCTSFEQIERITFSIWTIESELYWLVSGYKITNYKEPKSSEDN